MSVSKDSLSTSERAERVYYAPGVFLDAEDLSAEQTYHRGRLTRTLAYLHGWGTAAGLTVSYRADGDEVVVSPGVAVDHLGRLVEVPRTACVRLAAWVQWLHDQAATPDGAVTSGQLLTALSPDGTELVVDLFVRFAVCERGRTPAFALGPFDAIDATVPHRLRDSYELRLELRGGDDGALPASPWPDRDPGETFEAWLGRVHDVIRGAWWRHGDGAREDQPPPGATATADLDDPSAVFLARVRVPVTTSAEDPLPRRATGIAEVPIPPTLDESARRFVYPTSALMHLIDVLHRTP